MYRGTTPQNIFESDLDLSEGGGIKSGHRIYTENNISFAGGYVE